MRHLPAPGPGWQTRGMALSKDQKARLVVVAVAVQAVIAALTVRDINRRPDEAIRGPKRLWRLLGTVNTTGSAAYWIVGRKATKGAAGRARNEL